MCFCGFHILFIIFATLCPAFLKRVDFYKAHHSEKRGMLWLASYCVNTSSVRRKCYAPYRIVMPCPGATRIKPIINKAFVASSGDIITDYNDLYCLLHITMSAFVIRETTNNQHYTTLLKTRVWIVSGKFFKYENILTGCESEAPDCPCKVGIAPLYRSIVGYSPPRLRK